MFNSKITKNEKSSNCISSVVYEHSTYQLRKFIQEKSAKLTQSIHIVIVHLCVKFRGFVGSNPNLLKLIIRVLLNVQLLK